MTTIVVNTSEGYGIKDALPSAGAVKKGVKAAEEISKAIDAKDGKEAAEHALKAAENAFEGSVSFIPGGGPMVSGAKVMKATKTYAVEKVSSQSDTMKTILDALKWCL